MSASEEQKKKLVGVVERLVPGWNEVSLRIHAHPELALEEKQASAWLSEALVSAGFDVTRGVAELPTAFMAVKRSRPGAPVIAYFAEYDALPETGHSCGHNLIAAAACLAGHALSQVTDAAEVRVVGSPAEESYGGKITMLERGALRGIDFAMMAHGGFVNLPSRNMLGRKKVTIEFRGRSSSAALAPHLGLNALDAIVQTFAAVAMMRHQLRFNAKMTGIITHGGQAAHLIPDYTRGEFIIRTPEGGYMNELERRLLDCARGAALATGTTMEYQVSDRNYIAMNRNPALEGAYERNLRFIGEHVDIWPADAPMGSTDFANVSSVVPAIHSYFKMVPQEIDHHTPEYALASRSPAGLAGMLSAAKAMALTGLDLAVDEELRKQVQKDFQRASEPLPGTRTSSGMVT